MRICRILKYFKKTGFLSFLKMPQLDLVTFFDQTLYVYIFFIAQYIIVSVYVLPSVYGILSLKNYLYKSLVSDISIIYSYLVNSLILGEIIESRFEIRIVPFV